MASAFGHLIASVSLSASLSTRTLPKKFWALFMVSSVVPDVDALAFKVGIPYNHPLGHRGFTHSLMFAILWSSGATLLIMRNQKLRVQVFLLFLISMISHGFLDAMTNGGLGVGFFIPFDNHRYFFPFHPIEVSPIKVERFMAQAGRILKSEFIWIGIPSGLLLVLSALVKRLQVFKHVKW